MDKVKSKARHSLLHFLSFRPRSTKEVTDFLVYKEFDRQLIESLIQEFTETGLVDDLKFATWWTDSRIHAADTGPRLVEAQLRAKGVSPDVIKQALHRDWLATTLAAVKRQIQKNHLVNPTREEQQKLMGALVRRGFLRLHLERAFDASDGSKYNT